MLYYVLSCRIPIKQTNLFFTSDNWINTFCISFLQPHWWTRQTSLTRLQITTVGCRRRWVLSVSAVLTRRPRSAAAWRCIRMHRGYISSHVAVRTACQRLLPRGSMWQGVKLPQQFRPMIDGIQAFKPWSPWCANPSTHTDTHTHTWRLVLFSHILEEATRQQNLLTSSSNRTIRASAAVARPVNREVKPTQRAVIWSSRWPNHSRHHGRASVNRSLLTNRTAAVQDVVQIILRWPCCFQIRNRFLKTRLFMFVRINVDDSISFMNRLPGCEN